MHMSSRLAYVLGMAFAFATLPQVEPGERDRLPVGQGPEPPLSQAVAPAIAPGISRKQVVAGDPVRGSLVAWCRGPISADGWKGPLPPYLDDISSPPTWTLGTAKLMRKDLGKDRLFYDPSFHGEVWVPGSVRPGTYQLAAGSVSWPVEVVSLPPRKARKSFAAGSSLATIQAAVDAGNDILLGPGLHEWPRALSFARALGVTITGPGAVVRYSGPTPAPGDEWTISLIRDGSWAVIDGVTFDLPAEYRPFAQDTCPNLTLTRCSFIACGLNAPGPGLVCERCDFTGHLFLGQHGGLLRRCLFHDQEPNRYLSVWSADGNLAVIDCSWVRCERGLIGQLNWGNITNCLILGNSCSEPKGQHGGSEFLLAEGPAGGAFEFSNNLILHTKYAAVSGGGPCIQWDSTARGCLVRDLKCSGGWGLVAWGSKIENNVFEDVELAGGAQIRLRDGFRSNTFRRGAIAGFRPGSWNLAIIGASLYDQQRYGVWWDGQTVGPGNRFERWAFHLPVGVEPVQGPGIDFIDCTFNRAAYTGPK